MGNGYTAWLIVGLSGVTGICLYLVDVLKMIQ